MPAKNPRINIVLERATYTLIENLSHQRGVSLSTVARDLIQDALETYEDSLLAEFAEEREQTLEGRTTLRHDEVWE